VVAFTIFIIKKPYRIIHCGNGGGDPQGDYQGNLSAHFADRRIAVKGGDIALLGITSNHKLGFMFGYTTRPISNRPNWVVGSTIAGAIAFLGNTCHYIIAPRPDR
jgi:hypothetical protein